MGRLKTTTRVKAMDLDSKSKKPNNDKKGKSPKPPQKYKEFSASFSALLKGSQCTASQRINLWLAVKAPLFRALLFSLVTPRLRERALNHFQEQQNNNRTEPRVNLFSGLTVLGAKQKRCDGRVTFYFLIDQMARITDLCKPRASFPI